MLLSLHVAHAQSRAIAKSDYDTAFGYAVRETNAAFPFTFTVITDRYKDGKVVSTETEINERQAPGVERKTTSLTKEGQTLHVYSVMVGFGTNTYCSTDGITWIGPQQFVCPGPERLLRLYGPRTPESVEYTVIDKPLNGETVKVYREYSAFAASEPKGKKEFRERTSIIDPRGFFIEILDTEGTLDPRTVTLTRKQTWKQNAKFAPVEAPR